jgi:MFS family permease
LALVGTIAGLVGLTFATTYPLMLISAFVLGFSLLSAGPIGFQYGAEVAYPAPEGTSNGLLLLMGQISGIVFILAMVMLQSPDTGSMRPSLVGMVILLLLCLILTTQLKESKLLTSA